MDLQILTTLEDESVPYAFAFNRDGTRYIIEFLDKEGNEVARFNIIDDTFRKHSMTRSQAEFALDVISNELSDQDNGLFGTTIQRLHDQKPKTKRIKVKSVDHPSEHKQYVNKFTL